MVPSETSPKDPGSLQAGDRRAALGRENRRQRPPSRPGLQQHPLSRRRWRRAARHQAEPAAPRGGRPGRVPEGSVVRRPGPRTRRRDTGGPRVRRLRRTGVPGAVIRRWPGSVGVAGALDMAGAGRLRAAHQFDPCCRMGPHPRSRRPLRRKLDGAPRLQHRGPRAGRRTGGARVPDRGLVAPAARRARASRAPDSLRPLPWRHRALEHPDRRQRTVVAARLGLRRRCGRAPPSRSTKSCERHARASRSSPLSSRGTGCRRRTWPRWRRSAASWRLSRDRHAALGDRKTTREDRLAGRARAPGRGGSRLGPHPDAGVRRGSSGSAWCSARSPVHRPAGSRARLPSRSAARPSGQASCGPRGRPIRPACPGIHGAGRQSPY